MKPFILHTKDLAVGYGGTPLIRDIELSVRPGQILTLIGPNGAGKSTILKTITRQLKAVSGTIYLADRELNRLSGEEIAEKMSILMTERVEPELMTCEEVVSSGRYPYTGRLGILSREDWRKVDESMELVHVAELAHREFSRISDGQRQRVMLARAICQEPEVLVMDEPTSFLDVRHKLELLALLKELVREKQLAVVLSLHELDLAQKVSDTVLCVREGAVDRFGPPEEIFSGDYIQKLYGITGGSYNNLYGNLELQAPRGEAKVFVIGGGGLGIPVYRKLQRMGIPFAAGVLHENDLDTPVARALGAEVVTEQAFEPISRRAAEQAEALLQRCSRVICCPARFGTMNRGNTALRDRAQERGICTSAEDFLSENT